jgi:hypothetical protein
MTKNTASGPTYKLVRNSSAVNTIRGVLVKDKNYLFLTLNTGASRNQVGFERWEKHPSLLYLGPMLYIFFSTVSYEFS